MMLLRSVMGACLLFCSSAFAETMNLVRLDRASGIVEGSLVREEIEPVVVRNTTRMERCLQSMEGGVCKVRHQRLKVEFVIAESGAVRSCNIVATSLQHASEACFDRRCVENEVRGWTFPKPRGGGEVKASYTFLLGSQNGSVTSVETDSQSIESSKTEQNGERAYGYDPSQFQSAQEEIRQSTAQLQMQKIQWQKKAPQKYRLEIHEIDVSENAWDLQCVRKKRIDQEYCTKIRHLVDVLEVTRHQEHVAAPGNTGVFKMGAVISNVEEVFAKLEASLRNPQPGPNGPLCDGIEVPLISYSKKFGHPEKVARHFLKADRVPVGSQCTLIGSGGPIFTTFTLTPK